MAETFGTGTPKDEDVVVLYKGESKQVTVVPSPAEDSLISRGHNEMSSILADQLRPNARLGWLRVLSQCVPYSCAHGAQINFVDLLGNFIFNLLNKKWLLNYERQI